MIDRSSNLWWVSAGPPSPSTPLSGQIRADVVIVGAGIMGAAAAQSLAAAGVDVVLLEADQVGSGASSTPGGFVVPHFSVGAPDTVISRIGSVGEALVQATGQSAHHVFDKIRALGIDCDARQDGWYQPAHSAAALAQIHQVAEQWRRRGCELRVFDGAETADRTGVAGYLGSWFAPAGGTLHPLRYCRGLAAAAVASGCRLFERSPVLAIEREGGSHIVRVADGSVTARQVLICTNGLGPGLIRPLTRSIVPLRVWQCATAPIPADARRHLFQGGEALSDTRRDLFTYRIDREGRIITGALDAVGVSPARQARSMARRLQAVLRLPECPDVPFLWSGTSSISAPRYPATLLVDGGVVSATACNARGIALSTVIGDSLAAYVLHGKPPPVPLLEAGASRGTWIQRRLSRFYPHMGPILDWIDARRAS